jgi:hypothetical protein
VIHLTRSWTADRAGARRPRRSTRAVVEQRESLACVRDQLGHHSIKLTVDTYGHLVPGSNRQAVDRLDDATFRNLPATEPPAASIFASGSEDFLTVTADLTQ